MQNFHLLKETIFLRIYANKKKTVKKTIFNGAKEPAALERTLPLLLLHATIRYDQLLVIWNLLPVPTIGRFPDLPICIQNDLPDILSGCAMHLFCTHGLQ